MEPLRLVPFSHNWIDHEKLDLKGIYRRPRYTLDEWGERQREYNPDGLPTWDIVGPLPIRRHNDFVKKGFEFVTLANRESLFTAAKFGTLPEGKTARDYDQHVRGGPWDAKRYHLTAKQHDATAMELLKANVEKYGAEAYEAIRRETDPSFSLPESMKAAKPEKAAKKGTAA